ncbi:MAG: histidine kinase [Candidatus Limivivens sp.]|nr:histidine kinase [Candidatus Limivivens sp.]
MKKTKLQTRFFLAYLAIALLVTAAFSIFFYRYTSRLLIERQTKAAIDLNASFLSGSEAVLDDLDTVSINICYSNLVKDRLTDDLSSGSSQFRSLADLIVSINGADLMVDQINIYDYEGYLIQVGIRTVVSSIDLSTLEWLPRVQALDGTKCLSVPYKASFSYSSGSSWYISLYRTFTNRSREQVGVIETVKTCQSIFKSIISYQQKNADAPDVFVYNEDGALIFPYDLSEEEKNALPDYLTAASSGGKTSIFKNPETGEKNILVSETSSATNWTYITVQPESVVLAPVAQLQKLLLLVITAMLAVSAYLSWNLSKGLILPIRRLQGIIAKTELDTLGKNAESSLGSSIDELEELNAAFQNMSANLKASMDDLLESRQQELKSRTLALQSQINPHFYYNTLSSIIVLAENNQSEEVITLCRNLTKIMRYITKSQDSTVSLREEIDYIRQYLYCMKVRYQSSLNYEIRIDEEILDQRIPKLIIQPLVENALKYGTDCPPPWNLTVESQVTDSGWEIFVRDSGNGFSQNRIDLISQRIREAQARPGMPEMELGGMGLLNVCLRWKYFCQEEALFTYGNTPDGHGQVSIGRRKKQKKEEGTHGTTEIYCCSRRG